MTGAPWSIWKNQATDEWLAEHPQMHAFGTRKVTRFATHAEALAFVLGQPEVRRRTQRRAATT